MHVANPLGVMSFSAPSSLTLPQLGQLLTSLPENLPQALHASMLHQILQKHYALDPALQSDLLGQAVWQRVQLQQRLDSLQSQHQQQIEELHAQLARCEAQLEQHERQFRTQRTTLGECVGQLDQVLCFLSETLAESDSDEPEVPVRRANPRILSARR
jgi:chromosome segregation ATPase